jgi:hypothetical protein
MSRGVGRIQDQYGSDDPLFGEPLDRLEGPRVRGLGERDAAGECRSPRPHSLQERAHAGGEI